MSKASTQAFADAVRAEMSRQGMTAHRLHRLIEERGHEAARPTIYNFLAGKQIKSDVLAAVFDVLDLVVMPRKERAK